MIQRIAFPVAWRINVAEDGARQRTTFSSLLIRSWTAVVLKLVRPLAAASCSRAPVKIERRLGLADVFERNRQVVGVIGIVGLQVVRLKERLLRVGPAVLVDVIVAERKVKVGGRVARDQLLEPGFGAQRFGAAE